MDQPRRFGKKYELLDRLATGGMAEVFLARSVGIEGFQKRLVIKRILPALSQEEHFVRMFVQEAKITAQLSHPNIVQIFELGRVKRDHYIAMEYIHGRDLARINRQLRRDGATMPVPLVVFIIANLLRGLAYAHALTGPEGRPLQLVHRDVSPHNVLVSFQGEIKLLDFGIARLADEQEARRTGRVGGGKYAYMSPEQAAGGALDTRSDIFSAGIVLFELLSGQRLFKDPNPQEKLRKVIEADFPDPRETLSHLPAALLDILVKMLQRDPADRYADAERVEEDLWAFLFHQGGRADAAEMSAFMKALFPDIDTGSRAHVDIAGLADDIGRMNLDFSDPGISGSTPAHVSQTEPSRSVSTGQTPPPLKPGERRTVCVLVAELCGLTDLSVRDDPTAVVRMHYQLLRRIRRVVDRYDGFLESFRDDTFVVFFGMERTRESDLEQALACAGSLKRTVDRNAGRGAAVGIAVGAHSGEIIVGSRSGRTWRYLARGDTMKLARRLCIEADIGQILVSPSLAERLKSVFSFKGASTFQLKGQSEPIRAMEMIQRRRDNGGPPGRWMRRGPELEILADALRTLSEGGGGLIGLTGEGGVGKSRLLREVARLAKSRGVPFFSARALSYGSSAPLAPVRDLVAAVIGVEVDDEPQRIQARLDRLSQLRLIQSDRRLLGALFGLNKARPEEHEMLRAAAVLMRRLAEDQPIILALDDVHNLTPLALELIRYAIQATVGMPALYLVTAPETLPEALGAPRWSIRLAPLDDQQQRRLIGEMLGVGAVGDALVSRIARTTGGNALYVSLVVKDLRRSGRLAIHNGRAELVGDEPLELPPGMDALIAARIDELDDESRRFLHLAAVVGMSFSVALAREASHSPEPDVVVERLENLGLLETQAEGRCSFSSPLVWEVVRRSIVGNRLRQLHALVADGIKRLYGDNLEPHWAELAQHYAAAGERVQAAEYALLAGGRLKRQNLLREALAMWQDGLDWLEAAQRSGADPRDCQPLVSRLWLHAGAVSMLLGDHTAAERWLLFSQEVGSESADAEVEARASLQLGRMYRSLGRSLLARANLASALQVAQQGLGPSGGGEPWRRKVAVIALEAQGMIAQERGHTEEGAALFEQALVIAGDDDRLAAGAMLGLAGQRIQCGEITRGLEMLHQARRLAETRNDRLLLGRVVNNIGIAHFFNRDYGAALENFRSAVEIRQGVGYRSGVVVNYHNIGDTFLRMGEMGRAWAAFQRSRDLAREMGWAYGVQMNLPFIAFIEGLPRSADGLDPQEAISRMDAAVETVRQLPDLALGVAAIWLKARLLIARGANSDARQALDDALRTARTLGDRHLIRDIEETMDQIP
ncbi:MAG: protein kinase [Myxococcota bacterium]